MRWGFNFIGDDIHILLLIAVGIDAAILPGDTGQRSIRDERRKIDRRGGNGGERSYRRRRTASAMRSDRDANAR